MMPIIGGPAVPEHCNMPTDLRVKTESNDSLTGGGTSGAGSHSGSSGVSTSSHTQIDQSNAPSSSQSMNLSAVIAAGNEAVCSAPGTKLHAA